MPNGTEKSPHIPCYARQLLRPHPAQTRAQIMAVRLQRSGPTSGIPLFYFITSRALISSSLIPITGITLRPLALAGSGIPPTPTPIPLFLCNVCLTQHYYFLPRFAHADITRREMPALDRATRGRFPPTTGLAQSPSVFRVFK